GEWGTIVPTGTYPNYTDATVLSGYCYKYRYSVSDNVSNPITYTSENVAKVDTSAPVVSSGPSDNSSSATTPTDAGDDVTFDATALESGTGQYRLIVCKTTGLTESDCDGGSSDRWCKTDLVNSSQEASCTYTTSNASSESNVWYAYVCDTLNNCSSVSQGSGDSGSPFNVNHRPTFASVTDTGPIQGGQQITFNSVASDPDTDTVSDRVSLLICKTSGVSGTACEGGDSDTWCPLSSAASSNPSCSATISVTPGAYSYYAYIFDNHGFEASTNPLSGTFTTNASFVSGSVSEEKKPIISNIFAYIKDNIATITWTTDVFSNSYVQYGLDNGYAKTVSSKEYVLNHSLEISDLESGKTYHYIIKSVSYDGVLGYTGDMTFNTNAVAADNANLIIQLQAKLAQLQTLLLQLLAAQGGTSAITGIPATFTFTKYLYIGKTGIDVRYLQIVLNSDPDTKVALAGAGSSGNETTIFGSATKAAVLKFQNKYGIAGGTGATGPLTRAKLNVLLGK
ncbi:MAG: peptidoglycan-binding protein, partial [Candidatus Pacebacteria bacterium]|nr:peptidoglycan-binding protein [Candidatus Paceibacterota bacterium]